MKFPISASAAPVLVFLRTLFLSESLQIRLLGYLENASKEVFPLPPPYPSFSSYFVLYLFQQQVFGASFGADE